MDRLEPKHDLAVSRCCSYQRPIWGNLSIQRRV